MAPSERFLKGGPPEGYAELEELAFDLRSGWNHGADSLWAEIDPTLWATTGNAWVVLQNASEDRLRELLDAPAFRRHIEELGRHDGHELWFKAQARLRSVAFFSMEFALSEALPVYSGGLGNVAGDYVKAASDLGVPLVGVGLLYQQGYFRQSIDASGAQREYYPFNDTAQLPIAPVRNASGEWVRVRLPRAGPSVWLRAWRAQAGHVPVYLLDSNDPSNRPADRGITAQLYGGDDEVRLLQEMALGIGGWRLLRAIGVHPDVCHLNEGHTAFATLERARDFMHDNSCSFATARAATRAGNVFTTHTPVASGFDRFDTSIARAHLSAYADDLGLPVDELIGLGRVNANDESEPLCTAWLAMRMSGYANGVSRRHGQVSRHLFQVLYPRWPEAEIPVGHVTNGVHVPSWDSAAADALWTSACGEERWVGMMEDTARITACTDETLWALRAKSRAELVGFVRERLYHQLSSSGLRREVREAAHHVLDADTLTIGMARRFTEYKRPTLLLRDVKRFVRILSNVKAPVQIIVAGKAHPRDEEGKTFVRAWLDLVRRADVRMRAVFLADYDLRVAERLVQGVDLWINTPRPPWEACGTSGMKVLVNGGLNLSSLDGWWAEAYTPQCGWAIEGDGQDDGRDAERLYELLEREVVPSFYERDARGLPHSWLSRVRESMATLTPVYSANRALREYTDKYYVPAATAFATRSADHASVAQRIVDWEAMLRERFGGLRLSEMRVTTANGRHAFGVSVYLDSVDPDAVAVELYADGDPPARIVMRRDAALVGSRGYVYVADVEATRPTADFTPRIVPAHAAARVPSELELITWAR